MDKKDLMLGIIRKGNDSSELYCDLKGKDDFNILRNALVVFALNHSGFFDALVDVVNAVIDDEDTLRGQLLRAEVEGHLEDVEE